MSSSDLSVGSELFGYRVERFLGRGGMGVVYLAEDLRLRRRVALKLLAPSLAQDERFRERFLAESKLAASLDHPCVVPVYEAGDGGGLLFMAMRYVEGSDLKALLRDGPLTWDRAVGVCARVADALDFAHERGLVHRDVKPSNVLLAGGKHVYLADFGLMRRLAEPRTDGPGLLGTIDYVAPEQIRDENLDGRADVYSLGCLLHECLTGEPPFPRSTNAAVLFAHLEEQPPAPRGLEVVMQTALAKEPNDRYRTCAELVDAAAEALGIGEPARSGLPRQGFLLGGVVCPFKGLAFFDRSDAEYFCGRERVISELIARLAASTLVGILGPSGIGKSSLLRAGVLPALSAGVLPGSAGWRQVLLRPGEHPCAELARVVGEAGLDAALSRLAGGERLVVAIDQLEELFTTCEREEERVAFLDQLATAARDHDQRALVLASLRADFYGRLVSYPGFAQLLSGTHVLVGPMGSDELAEAIEQPASRAGLKVERLLVEALVSDVVGEPGGLPLLSTMLLELWRARAGRTLRFDSYRTSGGVRGAVARLAERAFTELDEPGRRVARGVMLRLVSGESAVLVRRRVPLSELQQIDGAERVLAALTDARLLTASDGEVEISHEALLQEWPRYRAWLEEDRVGRRLHAHLTRRAREWDARGRDPGDLYRGARLAGALEWVAEYRDLMNAIEWEFVDASKREAESEGRRQRSQDRRLRGLRLGVGALLVIAVVAGIVALVLEHNAQDQARVALARQLSVQAVNEPRIDVAMLLAREAVSLDRSPQTESALLATLEGSPDVIRTFSSTANELVQPTLAPDGRTLAISDSAGLLHFYDPHTYAVQRPPLVAVASDPAPTYSSDGSLLVYCCGYDGADLVVRDAHTLATIATLGLDPLFFNEAIEPIPDGILIAPDRRTVYYAYSVLDAAGNPTAAAYLDRWSLPRGQLLSTTRIDAGPLLALQLIDAGTRLLVVGARHVGVFDVRSLRLVRSIAMMPAPDAPSVAAISSDGRTVVIGSDTGSVSFVDASTGDARRGIGGHDASVASVLYSSDGRTVATVGNDDRVILWDPKTATPVKVLTGQAGRVQGAALSPDGTTLYTTSADGTLLAWDLAGDRQFGVSSRLGAGLRCCDPVSPMAPAVALSPDGSKFAARLSVSTVGLFSARTLQRESSFTIRPRSDLVTALAWSPSGSELAVAGHGGLVQLWRVNGTPELARSLVALQPPQPGLPEAIQALSFSPDGSLLAASDYNETRAVAAAAMPLARLAIWRVDTGTLTAPPRDLGLGYGTGGTDVLAFSRDGKALAVRLLDGCVLVLDATIDRIRRTLCPDSGLSWSLAFAPDGTLAIGTTAGTVELWNATTGDRIASPAPVAASPVTSIEFDPTGQRFATASYQDGTVKLWFTSTLQQEGAPISTDQGATSAAAFESDGKGLLVVDDRGNGFSWPMSLAAWEQRACAVAARNLTRPEWTQFVTGRKYTTVCP